ncbi:MAG: arylsulfatase [bacterium]|nr:arylsulfatase [bacterium]
MGRRSFFTSCATAAGSLALLESASAAQTSKPGTTTKASAEAEASADERDRPNILLIMTDQQRGDCLSIDGHPVLLTPTMDRIAGQGVRFNHAYTTCPSCIAARRSLLSGQFPATHGMRGYRDGVEWDAPPTLPQVLKENGYHTYLVGRNMHQHPPRKRYGYDHMVIHRGDDSDYEEWLSRRQPEGSGGYYGTGVMHNDWTARPWHMPEAYHQTNWTVNEALEFLRKRDTSCPFFLTVSFLAPHPPLIPPAPYMERYLRSDLPEPVVGDWAEPPANKGLGLGQSADRVQLEGDALRSARAAYYGLINHVDDQINRLLNPVTGIDRMTAGNTIVIFTSDHGEMLGDHYLWRKILPYEPSARIPFLIRPPKRSGIAAGTVVDRAVCLEDIMPTVLSMAGIETPETVEGMDLSPLMRGEDAEERAYIHIEHAPVHHTLTDGKEKYIWFVKDGREQFFDISEDPNELHDLAAKRRHAKRVAHWRTLLVRELADRPEGFSDGSSLIPGVRYPAVLPGG